MTDTFLTRSEALERLARGDVIFMEYRDGQRCWWFEGPYDEVSDELVQAVAFGPRAVCRLTEYGDSLFGAENSQSWKAIRGNKMKGPEA